MRSTSWGKGLGLVSFGFLCGIIVSSLNISAIKPPDFKVADTKPTASDIDYKQQNLAGDSVAYSVLSSTKHWDVLVPRETDGKTIALGKNGEVRVLVIDDIHALHVLTHYDGSRLWEGRLIDLGHDGTVEVADISGGHCENFSN